MTPSKPIILALCMAVTGCAQTSQQNSVAEGSHWWSFGGSEAGATAAAAPGAKATQTPQTVQAPAAANADATKVTEQVKTDVGQDNAHWWWPFGGASKPAASSSQMPVAAATAVPDAKLTQAWLDQYEPKMREAIKDSPLQLERRDNVLVITAPVDSSFNPKRPAMLLPVTLGPFSRVAKVVEGDPGSAILVLGHADNAGAVAQAQQLTADRAGSVGAIFRLSGFQRNRLMTKGMGSLMPRAANDSAQGRALNRRVEIVLTQQTTMLALLDHYNQASPEVPTTLLAANDAAKPAAPAPAAKAGAKKAASKTAVKKPVPAAKKTTAAAAKPATPVKKPAVAAKKPAPTPDPDA